MGCPHGLVFTQYLKFLLPLIIVVPGLLGPASFRTRKARPDLPDPRGKAAAERLVGLVLAGWSPR